MILLGFSFDLRPRSKDTSQSTKWGKTRWTNHMQIWRSYAGKARGSILASMRSRKMRWVFIYLFIYFPRCDYASLPRLAFLDPSVSARPIIWFYSAFSFFSSLKWPVSSFMHSCLLQLWWVELLTNLWSDCSIFLTDLGVWKGCSLHHQVLELTVDHTASQTVKSALPYLTAS